ncbi:MAG: GspH/FimT family pseudopilin [Gammaproteobacteria bacterium]|nr:GspH/FimT family pseudopilin [Gammaproteobacteria bacterium]
MICWVGSKIIHHHTAQRGFTLIELLLVLTIAAAMLAITPPLISAALPGVELTSAAREVAASLRYARSRAITEAAATTWQLDLQAKSYQLAGSSRQQTLPATVNLELVTALSLAANPRQGAVRFYADGSSSGGRLTLSGSDRHFLIDIDWLSGRITLTEG